jgi:8-oxo-dGTP diphosphatase
MKYVKVVGAVIVDEKDKILCAKRSKKMSMPGMWEFPGGKVEQDEDEKEALKREIKEELLCEIEVGTKIAETLHQYPSITVMLITYYATVLNGVPVNKEHEELVWIEKEKLKTLDWAEADIPTVKLLTMDL